MARRVVNTGHAPAASPRVELVGLRKIFGPVVACDDVDLTVRRGTIHAVVGENGAGKTTLMRCIAGLQQPDGGEIRFDGVAASVESVDAARALGVGMVHQEFSVVDDLTLAENLVLGIEPTRRAVLDIESIHRSTESLEAATGWSLPWDREAADVGIADLGRFEIVRQIHRGSDLLILDEPTAVLGPAEIDQLLDTMTRLRDEGRTIIFITHKLDEVMRVSDDITVLKGGRFVWSGRAADTDAATVARRLVGGEVETASRPDALTTEGEPTLVLDGVTVTDGRGVARLHDVSLAARPGEILGVYGVAGSGQRPLVEAIMGLVTATGTIHINGDDVSKWSPARRRAAGLSYISPDRRNEGLAIDSSLLDNAVAGQHKRPTVASSGLLSQQACHRHYAEIAERYQVKAAGPHAIAGSLSGGNQQRVVVGREISAAPSVMIASDPTRGVDIKGVADIHRFLTKLAGAGGTVLLVSHELDEVLALSHRIIVLLAGKVVGELDGATADRSTIAELMTVGRAS